MLKTRLIKIKLTSVNRQALTAYSAFVKKTLTKLNITVSYVSLPKQIKKLTVLKSPHVHKKAREQFELKTYKCLFQISQEINKKHLLFLFLNKPKFLGLSITKENV